MKIVMMTTWAQICGISDYSMSLVDKLSKDNEIKIIAPKLDMGDHHSVKQVVPDGPYEVNRLFNATIWDNIIDVEMDKIEALAEWADVFHIQFQDALYHHVWFPILIERIKNKTKLVVTLHDDCLGKIWPFLNDFKVILTMKPEVKAQIGRAELIGMPIHKQQPIFKGFGLGRSKHWQIQHICESLGYTYEFMKAEDKWIPLPDLIQWLRDSDGVILYYDDVSTAGSSSAARTALSTRRPVFVNRVTWFNDLPEDVVIKFNDDDDLKNKLREYFEDNYINENAFDVIADKHLVLYNL